MAPLIRIVGPGWSPTTWRWVRKAALAVGMALLGYSCPYWPERARVVCHTCDRVAHLLVGLLPPPRDAGGDGAK